MMINENEISLCCYPFWKWKLAYVFDITWFSSTICPVVYFFGAWWSAKSSLSIRKLRPCGSFRAWYYSFPFALQDAISSCKRTRESVVHVAEKAPNITSEFVSLCRWSLEASHPAPPVASSSSSIGKPIGSSLLLSLLFTNMLWVLRPYKFHWWVQHLELLILSILELPHKKRKCILHLRLNN